MQRLKRYVGSIALGMLAVVAGVAQGKEIVLHVATWDGEQGQVPLKEAADDFMKQHPGIKVQVEQLTGDYKAKLVTALAGGAGPEVYMIGDWDYAEFAASHLTTDLTPLLQRDGVALNQYIPQLLENHRYTDGKIYSLPKDFSTLGVYYNKDALDGAGVAYPQAGWTWDQALAMAKKLSRVGSDGKVTRYGLMSSPGWDAIWWSFAWSAGYDLMDPTFRHAKGYLDNPNAVAAMQQYADLVLHNPDAVVSPGVWDSLGGEMKGFASGQAALMIWGNWAISSWRNDPQMHWGTVVPPTLGRHATTFLMEAGWGLNPNLKDPDIKEAAWQLVKFLGTAPGQWHMSHALWAMPSVPAVASQVGILSDPYYKAFFQAAYESGPTYWTKVPGFGKVFNDPWQKAKNEALSGKPLKVGIAEVTSVIETNLQKLSQ